MHNHLHKSSKRLHELTSCFQTLESVLRPNESKFEIFEEDLGHCDLQAKDRVLSTFSSKATGNKTLFNYLRPVAGII